MKKTFSLEGESSKSWESVKTDVLICGGGPSGIAAAWGAAKTGVKTTLVERNEFLGGTPVSSLVSTMAYGGHNKKRWIIGGFFQEFRDRMIKAGFLIPTKRKGWEPINPEGYKMIAYEMLDEVGVAIQCGFWPISLRGENNGIHAVLCDSKLQRMIFEAREFVDATGEGDLSYLAGCSFDTGRTLDQQNQPATLCYLLGNVDIEKTGKWLSDTGRRGFWKTSDGQSYLNLTGLQEEVAKALAAGDLFIQRDHVASVFTIPKLTNVVGVNFGKILLEGRNIAQRYQEGMKQIINGCRFFQKYVPGFEHCELITAAPQVGIRTGRRIQGLYTITEKDILTQRQFEDVIAQGSYMCDVHLSDSRGTIHKRIPKGSHYDIPLRSIIARERNNLILAGRCISADFMAISALRVQVICMATGHAAGVTAALAAQRGEDARKLHYKHVQKILLSQGAILD